MYCKDSCPHPSITRSLAYAEVHVGYVLCRALVILRIPPHPATYGLLTSHTKLYDVLGLGRMLALMLIIPPPPKEVIKSLDHLSAADLAVLSTGHLMTGMCLSCRVNYLCLSYDWLSTTSTMQLFWLVLHNSLGQCNFGSAT